MFTGLIAYAPVNTPVFSLLSSVLSSSFFNKHCFLYSSTSFLCSFVVIKSTILCSGAKTQYVAPNNVSHLVVNTVNVSSLSLILKITSAPTDLPIQLICPNFTFSAKLVSLRPVNKSSA